MGGKILFLDGEHYILDGEVVKSHKNHLIFKLYSWKCGENKKILPCTKLSWCNIVIFILHVCLIVRKVAFQINCKVLCSHSLLFYNTN